MKCVLGGAILLVQQLLGAGDPYVVSRHVESPTICQQMARDLTAFEARFHFQTGCLIEIPAIKGNKVHVDR